MIIFLRLAKVLHILFYFQSVPVFLFSQKINYRETIARLENLDSRIDKWSKELKKIDKKYGISSTRPNKIEKSTNGSVSTLSKVVHQTKDSRQATPNNADYEKNAPIPLSPLGESTKKNQIGFSYSLCIPSHVDFKSYRMHYDIGHCFDFHYKRKLEYFHAGISAGTKILRLSELSMPWTVGRLEIPSHGYSYSFNISGNLGVEKNISDYCFLTANVGLGAGISWDNIKMGSTLLYDKDSEFLYGSINLGLGYRFSEQTTSLIFYKFDGYSSRNHFDDQFFNQIGGSLVYNF